MLIWTVLLGLIVQIKVVLMDRFCYGSKANILWNIVILNTGEKLKKILT